MSDYRETVTLETGESFEIYIKKPTNSTLNKAERHKAKVWNEAFKDGVMTKKEVQQIMEDRGIWNEEKAQEEAAKMEFESNKFSAQQTLGEDKLNLNEELGKKRLELQEQKLNQEKSDARDS